MKIVLGLFLASDLADISSNLRIIVFYFDIYFKSYFSFAINIFLNISKPVNKKYVQIFR